MTITVMPNGSKFNCSQTNCGLAGWLSVACGARTRYGAMSLFYLHGNSSLAYHGVQKNLPRT